MYLDKIHQPSDDPVVYWGYIQAWVIGSAEAAAAAATGIHAGVLVYSMLCCCFLLSILYVSQGVGCCAPWMELHMAALQGCLLYPTSSTCRAAALSVHP